MNANSNIGNVTAPKAGYKTVSFTAKMGGKKAAIKSPIRAMGATGR